MANFISHSFVHIPPPLFTPLANQCIPKQLFPNRLFSPGVMFYTHAHTRLFKSLKKIPLPTGSLGLHEYRRYIFKYVSTYNLIWSNFWHFITCFDRFSRKKGNCYPSVTSVIIILYGIGSLKEVDIALVSRVVDRLKISS